MIIKDMIQHDTFTAYARSFQALAWLWSADVGPLLCARHVTGKVVLLLGLGEPVRPCTYSMFYNLRLNDVKNNMKSRRKIRREMYEVYCPQLKTTESLRRLLLLYKKGLVNKNRSMTLIGWPTYGIANKGTIASELSRKAYEDMLNEC